MIFFTKNKPYKKFWLIVFSFVLVAFGLRLWMVYQTTPINLGGDEPEYVALGQYLLKERSYVNSDFIQATFQGGKTGEATAYRSPVLPFILAVHYKIFGFSQTYPRITLIFLSSFICFLLAWIGKIFDNPKAGLIAAAIWIIYPPSLFGDYSSDRLITEGIGTFFLIGAVAFFASCYKEFNLSRAILAGLFLGLAIFSRGYLLFLLPLYFIFIVFLSDAKSRMKMIMILLIAATIPAMWVIRNKLVIGKFALSTQTEHFYLGNNLWARGSFNGDLFTLGFEAPQLKVLKDKYPNVLEMSEIERSEMWTNAAIETITEHPKHIAWLLMRKSMIFFGPFQSWEKSGYKYHYLYSLMLLFSIFALFYNLRNNKLRYLIYLLIPFVAVYIAVLLVHAFDRYRFVVEPLIILVGSIGIMDLVNIYFKRKKKGIFSTEKLKE